MTRLTASLTLTPNDKQAKVAETVLDALDRWDARFQGHQCEKRRHPRVSHRSIVRVYAGSSHLIPNPDAEGRPPNESIPPYIRCYERCYEAWTRNVAQGGLAFIYPEQLPERHFVVEFELVKGQTACFRAEVRRSREVIEEFWEHAVAFTERVYCDPAPYSKSETAATLTPT